MPTYISAALLSMLGALIVAGIIAWIRRPRLAFIVPRLFSANNVSTGGQLAEITIFNRGFGNEEDVSLTLSKKFKYEVVGATVSDYSLVDNKLVFPRIGSNKDITVILTIEGGSFGLNDIESCLSRTTTGHAAVSLEVVPISGSMRLTGLVFFLAVPLLGYATIFGIDKLLEKDSSSVKQSSLSAEKAASAAIAAANQAASSAASLMNRNQKIPGTDWITSPAYKDSWLFDMIGKGSISIEFGGMMTNGDFVSVPILMKNLSNKPLKVSVDLTTTDTEKSDKIPSYDRGIRNVFVPSNSSINKSVKLIIHKNTADKAARTIWMEAFVASIDGETIKLNKSVVADLRW